MPSETSPACKWPLLLLLFTSSVIILTVLSPVCSATFTDSEKRTLLELHNRHRSGANPPAVAMNRVKWNAKLEYQAIQAAKECKFEHTSGPAGENIWMGTAGAFDTVQKPVEGWFNEVSDYNYATKSCNPGKVCGHYTQIMRDKVTEIGCGKQRCPASNYDIVFCQYNYGNVQNEPIYRSVAGKAYCEECPADRPCKDKLCTEINGNDGIEGSSAYVTAMSATMLSVPCWLLLFSLLPLPMLV